MQVIDLSMNSALSSTAAEPLRDASSAWGDRGLVTPPPADSFKQVMTDVVVQSGDTLVGLVRAHHRQQGIPLTENQAYRMALRVAERNQISNPDQIVPGQKVDFSDLQLPALDRNVASPASAAVSGRWSAAQVINERISERLQTQNASAASSASGAAVAPYEVLDKTLQRAVEKGFVSPEQAPAAKDRILALATKFGFDPDDFARLTLMESGGMNPTATNGRCHGIIQFCDGLQRGAAAVGLADQPRSILGMGLLQQLDLVDRYFEHNGLDAKNGKLSLDDLYLTVLSPAARSETRKDAPLKIPGPQAAWLHVGQDPRAPITRASLVAGLHDYAQSTLNGDTMASSGRSARLAARAYAQATTVAFADLEPLSTRLSGWTPAVLNSGRFTR